MWLMKIYNKDGRLDGENWYPSLSVAIKKAKLYEAEGYSVIIFMVADNGKRTLAYE